MIQTDVADIRRILLAGILMTARSIVKIMVDLWTMQAAFRRLTMMTFNGTLLEITNAQNSARMVREDMDSRRLRAHIQSRVWVR